MTHQPDKAQAYLTEATRANAENNFFHMNFMLDYMHASYYELTEQYDRALEQYGKIISELRPSYARINTYNWISNAHGFWRNKGKPTKLVLSIRTSALQDSLDNLSYVRQINELRTIYQIDQLEIKNQQERNRTILWEFLQYSPC